MAHTSQESPRPSLSVIRCRPTRGAGITLDPEEIDRKPAPTTTTGAWNQIADYDEASGDGWAEQVAELLAKHASEQQEHYRESARRHMEDIERRARFWPKKDRAERVASLRAAMTRLLAEPFKNAPALPTSLTHEATGAYVVTWLVNGISASGRTIEMYLVAPDGSEIARLQVATEPIALAANAARALHDLAESLNAAHGLRVLH